MSRMLAQNLPIVLLPHLFKATQSALNKACQSCEIITPTAFKIYTQSLWINLLISFG